MTMNINIEGGEMEEANSDGKCAENYSSRLITVIMKAMELARNMKVALVISTLVLSCCLLLYFFSYSNSSAGQFFSFTSSDIHDEYYELKKQLEEASTEDKTVILTTLNDAWAEPNNIFDIFIESFKNGINTSRLLNHVLVVAVDDKAYKRCRATVSHCYFFKSNHSAKMAHEAMFMSPVYLEMMWERLAFLHTILTLGYNFVFTDTDVMWFRDPFPNFYPDIDFQTSCDSFNGNPSHLDNSPNNGFNFVRSNNRTIEFYRFWVHSRNRYPGLHEQNVFNKIKYDKYVKNLGLSMRFLDTDYFGGFCSISKDFNKVCTMHANCCVGLHRKIADLNTISQDWKMYTLAANKMTTFHWRAPHECHM